jgi:hypothetical protein
VVVSVEEVVVIGEAGEVSQAGEEIVEDGAVAGVRLPFSQDSIDRV